MAKHDPVKKPWLCLAAAILASAKQEHDYEFLNSEFGMTLIDLGGMLWHTVDKSAPKVDFNYGSHIPLDYLRSDQCY